MGELAKLPNIGRELERQLLEYAGITTAAQLRQLGSRQAWLCIQKKDPSACLHRLYALEGAVKGIRKQELDPQTTADLQAFFQEHRL